VAVFFFFDWWRNEPMRKRLRNEKAMLVASSEILETLDSTSHFFVHAERSHKTSVAK
jgi:hypothetical protein